MKVVAIRKGFFAGELRRPGDEFVIKNKSELGLWMKEVRTKQKKAAEVSPAAPQVNLAQTQVNE